MRIAIQGEKSSFSHQAALQLVPELSELQSCALSPEVFERLASGQADAAVIPIENSLAGSVVEHYDLLLANAVSIHAEYLLRIRHHLIASTGVTLPAVREVFSHPVALAQCRGFFMRHPQIRSIPFYDTAGAVAHAVRAGGVAAGIASQQAALEYGGQILLAGIEDHSMNYTRFLLVRPGLQSERCSVTANKVSLAFAVPNQPGSLVAALRIFARHGLNLSRLESRPVPGSPWEYVFYADYVLSSEEAAALALTELARECSFVRELGRYTAAASALPEAADF